MDEIVGALVIVAAASVGFGLVCRLNSKEVEERLRSYMRGGIEPDELAKKYPPD